MIVNTRAQCSTEESVRGKEFKYTRYFNKESDRKQYLPDRDRCQELIIELSN